MTRQFLRVQRPLKATRQPLRRGVSTSRSPSGAKNTTEAETMSIGQSVEVKTGYISLTGNHGLEAGPDNTTSPLGAWRGTPGVIKLIRYDRVLVGLKAGFSWQSSEYWVRRSAFWRIFGSA